MLKYTHNKQNLLLIVSLFFAANCYAQTEIKISPEKTEIADKIQILVQRPVKKGNEEDLVWQNEIFDKFVLLKKETKQNLFRTKKIWLLELKTFEPGEYVFSDNKLTVEFEGKKYEETFPEIKLKVEAPNIDDMTDIIDIKGKIQNQLIVRILLIIVLISFFVFFAWILYKKMQKKETVEIKILPHEKALKEIEKLKKSGLLENGENKEYFFELSRILKSYIEERFSVNAIEMTTEEFFEKIRKSNFIDETKKEILREFFSLADMVKFAKYIGYAEENQKSTQSAENFIKETAPKQDIEE